MKLIHRIKPPCHKCPYKLGKVKFVQSPCPKCKISGYQTYYALVEGKSIGITARAKDENTKE